MTKSAPEPLPPLGLVLLAGVSLVWGLGWPVMKTALGEMQPCSFRTLSLVLGGVGILAAMRVRGMSLTIPKGEFRPLLLVALLNVTGWNLFSAYGIAQMKAGAASIIAFTMPAWATILSRLVLGEPLTLAKFLGVGLGIGGLAVLVGPDLSALSSAPVGALLMLAAAISWAAGSVLLKYYSWSMSTVSLTGWQLLLGSVPVILGTLLLEPVTALFHLTGKAMWAVAYVTLLGIIGGYIAWIKIVQLFPVSLASVGTLVIPVIGVFSSALFLGEPLGSRELVALFLVVAGIAVVLLRPSFFRPKSPCPPFTRGGLGGSSEPYSG
jgi:drug/metabolite transporter (DMT)-like permease